MYPYENTTVLDWIEGLRGMSLTGGNTLCPRPRHFIFSLVLVQPRKTRPNMTEKLLIGMYRIKTSKQKQMKTLHADPDQLASWEASAQDSYSIYSTLIENTCLQLQINRIKNGKECST